MDDNARTGELRRKLEKDPGSRLFAQLAEELRKEGKHDEAISVARKGLEKNPNYPSARLTLARALLDSGRPAEARPELESIVKASPDNIMASRLLGESLSELGEVDAALQQFEKTLRISPGDKAVLERIAELKARLAPAPPPAPPTPPPAAVFEAAPPVLPEVALPPAVPEPAVEAPTVPFLAAPTAPPAAASVALDRDLASGTFSPGTLNAADLQKHFEETAAAEAETIAFAPPAEQTEAAPVPAAPPLEVPAAEPLVAGAPELPAVEIPADDTDDGAKTLPLTSLTLADLYLQQGLKAEASAVLLQVLKEEPENAQARSKFEAVSSDLAQAVSAVTLPAPPLEEEPPPVRAPRTQAEIRERTILSLKAFASAAEREAMHQKATERGAL
ncbi:MAG: tetratricopeptide repeat protein [Vicinamibacteria bacterium]|nr:tetratricopeptide repeat protein [Vicinamibacteria bacterium]